MIKLSAVIITFNEEKNIGSCIDSVSDIVDEILVVDSFSSDRTELICKEKGAKFIQNKWEGYSEQKNFANTQAAHNYILSLDADEALSEELKASVLILKQKWELAAYRMNRLTNYCGSWIKHGSWYPDRQLRLFDRTKGQWNGAKIHEKFETASGGQIGHIKGDLLHFSYHSVSDHVKQANHFTDITAVVAFEKGKRSNILKIFFSPIFKFLRDYIFKLGFLDGYHGFIVCQISANATFLKYVKLKELWERVES